MRKYGQQSSLRFMFLWKEERIVEKTDKKTEEEVRNNRLTEKRKETVLQRVGQTTCDRP